MVYSCRLPSHRSRFLHITFYQNNQARTTLSPSYFITFVETLLTPHPTSAHGLTAAEPFHTIHDSFNPQVKCLRISASYNIPKKKAAKEPDSSDAHIATPMKQAAGTKRKRNDETNITPKRRAKISKQEVQDCDICAETRPLYRNFPHISTCEHDPTVCSDCYRTHFLTRIDADRALGWLACNCPLCAEPVHEEDVRGVLPRTLGKELDTMIRHVSSG